MDVYTRVSNEDAYDYDQLKKALLTRCILLKMAKAGDSGMSIQRLKKRQTSSSPTNELPSQLVRTFWKQSWRLYALVDLMVKEQFINACSDELDMYLLDRGPKYLVELTKWDQ